MSLLSPLHPQSLLQPHIRCIAFHLLVFSPYQVTKLYARSLERLVEGQAEVRVTQDAIVAILPSHTWPGSNAAHCWPFLLWGCSVSTVCFLQAAADQQSSPVPTSCECGLDHRDGEFGEGRVRMALLSFFCREALVLLWCCCSSSQRACPSSPVCITRELNTQAPCSPVKHLLCAQQRKGQH